MKKEKLTLRYGFLTEVAMQNLTPTEMNIVLVLSDMGTATQATIANQLGIARQNANKAVKKLLSIGLLKEVKTEGRNIFLEVNQNFKHTETDESQLKLF